MDVHTFLPAAVILLLAAAVSTALFKRMGLGSVLGFLVAGVVVGPSGLGVSDDVETLRHFAELGVVLLLFIIGLEMRPAKLWSMRRLVFGLGTLQVLVTGVLIGGYFYLLGNPPKEAILIGLGLALSSTAFVLQLLAERGEMQTEHGQACFGILLLQDLAIVPLLALVPLLSDRPADTDSASFLRDILLVSGALLVVIGVGRHLLPPLLRLMATQRSREAFSIIAMLAALGAAWLMELSGLSQALGAFLMGMLLSDSEFRHQIEAVVEPFKGFLLGLFFISVGMSMELELLAGAGALVLLHVPVILVIKSAVLIGLSRLFGLANAAALRVGLLLTQSGEFGFVLFGAAATAGLISHHSFGLLILVISVSMAATPLLARLSDWAAVRLIPGSDGREAPEDRIPGDLSQHVLVAGYGRVGRVVCMMLERSSIPYVALDRDPRRVAAGRLEGHEVHFGDVGSLEVLQAAGAGRAASLVVTVDETSTIERLVSTIRTFYPDMRIQSRVRDLADRDEMLKRGVSRAIPDSAEASLHLGEAVLETLGVAPDELDGLLHDLRRDGYALLRAG